MTGALSCSLIHDGLLNDLGRTGVQCNALSQHSSCLHTSVKLFESETSLPPIYYTRLYTTIRLQCSELLHAEFGKESNNNCFITGMYQSRAKQIGFPLHVLAFIAMMYFRRSELRPPSVESPNRGSLSVAQWRYEYVLL